MIIEQISDKKVKIVLSEEICIKDNLKINKISSLIRENFSDCINVIIAYSSALFEFRTPIDTKQLKIYLDAIDMDNVSLEDIIVVTEIPVCYDEMFALDKNYVEEYTGLSFDEIVQIHTQRYYYIYFIGFLPGFPYLGGLDKRIHIPRKRDPRVLVPSGSVGIGGMQTGIYPLDSPGGWQIIGRTPLKLFDINRKDPFLLKSGEGVCFKVIDVKEYAAIEKNNMYMPNRFKISIKEVFND